MSDNDTKDTYHSRTNADELSGGRFKRLTPTTIVGATPVPSYPAQPASSPFAKGLDEVVGPEPPLGFDVNAQVPTGTEKEIQSSLLGGSSSSLAVSPSAANDQQEPDDLPTPAVSASGHSPSPKQQTAGDFSSNRRRF